MSDERSTFETTRGRLEDIVGQVRRKDLSLEQSLDLLEEAVRLVNQCNDLIDQTSFKAPVVENAADAPDTVAIVEIRGVVDVDGDGVPDAVVETVVITGPGWGAEDAWAGDSDVPVDEDDDARE